MSETALLSNYKQTDDDDAINWLRSYTAQAQQKEKQKPAEPAKAPEPVKPGGFFNTLASAPKNVADFLYPPRPVEQPGQTTLSDLVTGNKPKPTSGAGPVRRIVEKGIETMAGGAKDVAEAAAGTPPTEPQGANIELPGGITIPVPDALHRAGKALMGGINATPAGGVIGAAGQTGREVQGGIESLLPSLTDEKINERIEALKTSVVGTDADPLAATPANQQTAKAQQEQIKQLQLLLQKPYDERVKLAQEDTGTLFELVAGAMPMPLFLGAGKAIKTTAGAVGSAAREADAAAHAARIEAMRVAGERIAAERAAQQAEQATAQAAGGPRPPLTLADLKQGMQPEATPGVKAGAGSAGQSIPDNMMTLDKLHARERLAMLQRDPAARAAMNEAIPEASQVVSEPGLARREGKTTREQLREQNRTPLDAAPRQLHPYAPVEQMDEETTRLAREYDAAVTDPASKPAWDSLASDTDRMYQEIAKKIKVEKVTGQPYASAEEMVADMKKGVFKVTTDNSQHPFWTEDQNWKFRVVHDYLGHFETGADFSLAGEKKAFLAHAAQLTGEDAKKALQSEVLGQAASYTANAGKFPEQKAFIPKEKVSAIAGDHAEQIAQATNSGGASFDMASGKLRGMDEGGFYVSVAPDRMVTIKGRAVSSSDISRFAEQNADKLAQPGAHIGSEKLPDGTVNLDISVRTDKAEDALALAQQHGQKRIWDATLGKAIDVPQGNTPVKGVKVHHGTSTTYDDYQGSQFFAEKPETANHYANREMLDSGAPAGDAPQVRVDALTLNRPATEQQFRDALDLMQGDRQLAEELLKSKGYDGVTFPGTDTGKGKHYLAFDAANQAVPYYGQAASKLPSAVEAAQKRIMDRIKSLGNALTDETGSFQLRGSFSEGWEQNKKFLNDLAIVGSHYLWENPLRSIQDWKTAMIERFGNEIGPQLDKLYEMARDQMKKFTASAKAKDMPNFEQMHKAMVEGKPAWQWYDGAKEEFEKMFGVNAELFAKVYSAVSPMTEAEGSNTTLAFKAMDMIMSGERHEGALFRGADGFIGAHINNLNRILQNQPLSGPKVGEFVKAILGDRDANVVDRWMGRYFNFLKGADDTRSLNDSQIKFVQLAVEKGAQELGVDVRGGQAALWAVEKAAAESKEISEVSSPLHELIANYIKKNEIEREWVFPKAVEEALPSWVTEEGKIQMGTFIVLGRAALAGTLGAMTGDNPETAIRNGLLAAGIGAALSPKLARILAEQIAKPEVMDAMKSALTLKGEEGAVNLRFPKRGQGENPSPNTARMGASKEAKQLVRGINEKLSEAGRLDRDTTKSFEEIRAEAARSPFNTVEGVLGMDTAKLSLDELPGAITAARDVRDMALESVLQKAAQAKLAQDPELAKDVVSEFLLSGKISEQVTNAQTAYARGLGAQRMQSKASRAASKYNIDGLESEMAEMRKALITDGKVSDLQLVDMITNLADKAATAKIAEVGSKWPQALWNIYYGLNLLSSPLTQVRNVIGNMGGLSMAVADRAFGEIIAAPFHIFGKGENMVQLGETYQLAKGLWQVVGDTFRAAKDAKAVPGGMRSAFLDSYRTGESSFIHGGSKSQEMLRTIEMAKEQGNGSLPVLIQAMSTLAEKNMRIMGGVDEAFKVLTFHSELRALALREAKGAGLEGKDLAQEIERLVASPNKDMLAMAEAAAHENTFTKAFSSQSNGWRNLGGAGGKLEDFAQTPVMKLLVSPFYRTPMRVGEFSTVHTPGLNFLAVQFYSDLAEGGVKANMAWAKLATGSAIVGLVGWYAAHGYITGNWPDDPGLKASYERAGWKPKSLYVPLLGKYVSYDNLEPLSTIVGTVADTIQIGRDLPEWHASTLMSAATIAAAKNSINKTWFQGVSDLVDVIEGANKQDSTEKLMTAVENRLVTAVPGAALMRLVANATDEQRRDRKRVIDNEYPELREVDTLLNTFKAIVPGWSKTRPAIPNMVTGEPLPSENSWLGALSPFQFSTLSKDKVLTELVALDGAGLPKELPRAIGGSSPPSPFKFPGDEEREVREGILMSDKERARLGQILTKEVEDDDGNTLHKALAELMDTEEYKDASDGRFGGKSRLMASKFQEFMGLAQQQLLDEYPKLDAAVRQRKVMRDLQQLPKSQEDQRSSIMEQATGQ